MLAPDPSQPVYKIVGLQEWEAARATGTYEGSAVDRSDGFIHFSTAMQVAGTAAKHFAGRNDLLLVAIDGAMLAKRFGDDYRYEPSRGGQLFPHLYGSLPLDAVVWVRDMPLGENGTHNVPRLG